jgi:hypothetical protein
MSCAKNSHTCARTHTCTHTHTHARTHAHTHTHTHTHTHRLHNKQVRLEDSLLSNSNLFPELYLHQMLPPLLTCVVSKSLAPPGSAEDHWALRRLAAQTVGKICRKFGDKWVVRPNTAAQCSVCPIMPLSLPLLFG